MFNLLFLLEGKGDGPPVESGEGYDYAQEGEEHVGSGTHGVVEAGHPE